MGTSSLPATACCGKTKELCSGETRDDRARNLLQARPSRFLSAKNAVRNDKVNGSGLGCLAFFLLCLLAVPSHAQEARSSGWVVIPVGDYRVLRAKAYPVEPDPEPPPVQATLTRVDYDLQIAGEVARGRASLTVDVLKDGWVRVPVPSGLLVREARIEGKLVSLVPGGGRNGQLTAVLSHPGRSVLTLDIALPVTSSTGTESISLPATESGITKASIQIAQQGVEIRVSGGLISEKSEPAGGSKWVAYARGGEPLGFSWRRKTEGHMTTRPLRMRGSLIQLVSLGEDSTSIYAEVNLEIAQGATALAKIQLPDNVTVNQVLGAMMADWEVKDGTLTVKLLEPVDQSARFVINGEVRLPREGQCDVPLLRLLGTERDSGGVAVEVLGAGEIKDVKQQGLEDADATDLGEMIASRQSPSLAAFRYRAGEIKTRSLTVNVTRYAQQAVLMANIEEARYQVLMSQEGKTLVQARYAVRNNQRNFVKVTLPPGAAVWSALLAGNPVRPGQAPDGSLLLPLEKARGGEDAAPFVVEVLYLSRAPAWDDKGHAKLVLPGLDLPISRTGIVLFYPPLFRVAADPGTFRAEAYAAPISAAFAPQMVVEEGAPMPASAPEERRDQLAKEKDDKATQALVDKFRRKSESGKVTGILPIGVSFPEFGPSIYLTAELTGENQAASADFTYQREKNKGAR